MYGGICTINSMSTYVRTYWWCKNTCHYRYCISLRKLKRQAEEVLRLYRNVLTRLFHILFVLQNRKRKKRSRVNIILCFILYSFCKQNPVALNHKCNSFALIPNVTKYHYCKKNDVRSRYIYHIRVYKMIFSAYFRGLSTRYV